MILEDLKALAETLTDALDTYDIARHQIRSARRQVDKMIDTIAELTDKAIRKQRHDL